SVKVNGGGQAKIASRDGHCPARRGARWTETRNHCRNKKRPGVDRAEDREADMDRPTHCGRGNDRPNLRWRDECVRCTDTAKLHTGDVGDQTNYIDAKFRAVDRDGSAGHTLRRIDARNGWTGMKRGCTDDEHQSQWDNYATSKTCEKPEEICSHNYPPL